ncbi:MAG: H/ACA RNA-protein complex protein Gar1 [Candidatus Heimdallarchaeota archaeon]|nr:H/ACA RNA-protein complex protein Gar1 [Candidatus Heimdallarchaeota archaeon]
MKKLGPVTIITRTGELLVRINEKHKIGSNAVNKNIQRIGKVIDIIGPVRAPYVVINTKKAEASARKGEVLYSVPRKRRNKRGNYRRR